MTTATGYAYVESVDLLMKDGWAYMGLTVPPEALDVGTSKRQEPGKWHRWKQVGGDVMVEGTSGQWTKVDGDRVRPLPSGAGMNVNLIHRTSARFGGMGSYNTSGTITLLPNGRYHRGAGVIAGTGTVQAGGGFTGGASASQDQNGRRSASAGSNGTVTATTTSRGHGDADAGGTYAVSGYALELHGDGGGVRRVLAFYPFADNTRVYIDGVTYNTQGH
jgi:hypothetical protein